MAAKTMSVFTSIINPRYCFMKYSLSSSSIGSFSLFRCHFKCQSLRKVFLDHICPPMTNITTSPYFISFITIYLIWITTLVLFYFVSVIPFTMSARRLVLLNYNHKLSTLYLANWYLIWSMTNLTKNEQITEQTRVFKYLQIIYKYIYVLKNFIPIFLTSVQFTSVAQSCLTLCDPMNHSTPGLPVHHQLPEFTQTHVHQVSDAIQPSHPPSSSSPPAPNPSQQQSLFQWVNSSHEVAKELEFQL